MTYLLFVLMAVLPGNDLTVIQENFVTPSQEEDNLDSIGIYNKGENHWAIVTSKAGHFLAVFDAVTGAKVRDVGRKGSGPVEFSRPNGILVLDDYVFVVERDNHRVQVLKLPEFSFVTYVGRSILKRPYGLDAYRLNNGDIRMFVTDDYKVPAAVALRMENPDAEDKAELEQEAAEEAAAGKPSTIPDDFFTKRIKQFTLSLKGHKVKIRHDKTFGEKDGVGQLYKVESITADPLNNRLYICDEKGPTKGIKIYDLDGVFTGKMLTGVDFGGEPEGVALFPDGHHGGYLICTDQQPDVSVFHVLERNSLKVLGSFRGERTTNTDGIVVHNRNMGAFAKGGMWAIHDDQALSGFDWSRVAKAIGL